MDPEVGADEPIPAPASTPATGVWAPPDGPAAVPPGSLPTGGEPRRAVIGVAIGALAAAVVGATIVLGAGASGGDRLESTVGGRLQPSASTAPATATSTTSTEPPAPSTTAPGVVTATSSTSTTATSSTRPPTDEATEAPPATAPPQDDDDPAVVARPVPVEPPPPPPAAPPPPWAASRRTTSAGHVSTDVGCAGGTSATSIDAFLAGRVGPVLGWDYQHVYDLGGDRQLWLFQDTFVDQSGTADTLDKASFVHNTALVQDGSCFRLLHRGTAERPEPFEPGTGTATLQRWFWPMGGEVHGDRLYVVWAEMEKDAIDPTPPDGLGWHPVATHIATYDVNTLTRMDFRRAPNAGAAPIYGYAMASDSSYTYLFGNTFEQNMTREGGWFNGPHSATHMYLARVGVGRVFDAPEYWTSDGWVSRASAAEPFLSRHWVEFPMQPRYIDGQWVATTAVNGYWGEEYTVDVANRPWGPWTTVEARALLPRNFDPKMNTYHAHLLPRRGPSGNLVVAVSNNARDMLADAWPQPSRYRPTVFTSIWQQAPPPTTSPPTTVRPTTTAATTTSSSTTTSTTSTTTTSTTTTSLPAVTATTTTTTTTSTTTTTTAAPTTTTTPPTTSSSTSVP